MKIYIVDLEGDIILQKGSSIVVEFNDGKTLELIDSPKPLPPEIPDGIHIWGGRIPSPASADRKYAQLNITPVAANGIIVSPHAEKMPGPDGIAMFIADDDGHLQPVSGKKVMIELQNGKTLEVMEHYAKNGLLVWGGREPVPGLPLEKLQERTESLGLYPVAGNIVHVFPYKLK